MFREIQFFLTFRCSGNCPYCIQGGINRNSYKEISSDNWIKLFDLFPTGTKIGLIGGEPTLYKGLKEIIEAKHNSYFLTVTTNLKSSLFTDLGKFIEWASKCRVRWNVSFHPSSMDVDHFINTVKELKINGIWVDQVASVMTPESMRVVDKLLKANIGFWLQTNTYLDDNGILHPTEKEFYEYGYGETNITNVDKYNYLCGGKKNVMVLCSTGKFLVNPEGMAFRCHRDLYLNENSIGNAVTEKITPNYVCHDVGTCNPCDYSSINCWEL